MKIQLHGACATVTGSRTLVTEGDTRVLVDCGMFQGWKDLRLRNWEPFPFGPQQLDAVLLTHAHLDHSGALPLLAKQGFRGPIVCTPPTAALLSILLHDSARLQEEDARFAARRGTSRHQDPRPLFTTQDAEQALRLVRPCAFHEDHRIGAITARFSRAGHILGAASLRLQGAATAVLFSGDLGRPDDLVLPAAEPPPAADLVVCESTYGDRHHDARSPVDALGEVLSSTLARGGVALIPAFAVGRVQALLRAIAELKERGTLPDSLPVVVDSPMAVDVTELHGRFASELRPDDGGGRGLSAGVQLIQTREASKQLNRRRGPYVLISSAGMLTGGRVLHHLARLAPVGENSLVLVGYQAPGTRGARLLAGERTLRMHGQEVAIGCEVATIGGFSAHADQQELLEWLGAMPTPPQRVLLNHGESSAADALRQRVERELGWPCQVARDGRLEEVEARGPLPTP